MQPTKRTEKLVLDVLARVQAGMPVKRAAQAAGIDPSTWYRWRVADPDLDLTCQRARAVWLQSLVEAIDVASQKDWRAAAWLLSRSDRAEYGDKVEVRVEADPNPVIDLITGEVLEPAGTGPVSPPPQVLGTGEG